MAPGRLLRSYINERYLPLTKIDCWDLGCCSYQEAYAWQRRLALQRQKGLIDDQLLLLEHPPVITLGKRDASADLLLHRKSIKEKGIEIIATDRGGKITYHGPGQLVAYFIFHLRELSIPEFVRRIEEIVIGVLAEYQVEAHRDAKYPGVWVEKKKIAAVGFHVDRHVSTHGVALNVSCDLRPFRYFHPCGITDCQVTSMEAELGWTPPLHEVKSKFIRKTIQLFQAEWTTSLSSVAE